MNLGKVGVIVAARMGSSRLPGKAMLPLKGVPMVLFLLRRLRPSRATVILATTELSADDELAGHVAKDGFPVFRGSNTDLVARYVAAASRFGFDTVARVTADCPFVDADLVDGCIALSAAFDDFDLSTTKGRYPVGLDVEIYPAARMAALNALGGLTAAHREHLTLYFYDHPDQFVVGRMEMPAGWAGCGEQFTVDTADDYQRAQRLVSRFHSGNFAAGALVERRLNG